MYIYHHLYVSFNSNYLRISTPAVTYGVMADRNFMIAGSKLRRRFPAREMVRRRKGKGEVVVVWTAESLSREQIRRGRNGMGRRGGDGEEEEEKEDRHRKGWWWRRRHVESKWDE
ncbi:hypothetical protein DM860_012564 [Cuscuta australis]|uniref:Uncharacterized protein n=1 Tax=Cuscuta australis TaxID=267555 RepID=A0A328DHE4_9ASTE|nr:hypothetical protein DM860_012564 [Cuscuta australis]